MFWVKKNKKIPEQPSPESSLFEQIRKDTALQQFAQLLTNHLDFFLQRLQPHFGEINGFLKALQKKQDGIIENLLPTLKRLSTEKVPITHKAFCTIVLELIQLKLSNAEPDQRTRYPLIANTALIHFSDYETVFSAAIVPEADRVMLLLVLCILGSDQEVNFAIFHGYLQYVDATFVEQLKVYHYDGFLLIMPAFLSGQPLHEIYAEFTQQGFFCQENGNIWLLYAGLMELAARDTSVSCKKSLHPVIKPLTPHDMFYARIPFKSIRPTNPSALASEVLNTQQSSRERADSIRGIIQALPNENRLKNLLEMFVCVHQPSVEIVNRFKNCV